MTASLSAYPALTPIAMHVQAAVENVIIDQVRIERVLVAVLIPDVDLCQSCFTFKLAEAGADLIGVTLVPFTRMAGGGGPIVGFEIDCKIAEETHRNFAKFSSRFPTAYRNEKAVNAGLILRQRRRVR